MSTGAEEHFEDAAAWLSSTPAAANLSNDVKLEIYGLYKVATTGPEPDSPAPSFFSLPATKAKWNAWKSEGDKYGEDEDAAKDRYVEIAIGIGYEVGKKNKVGMGGVFVSSMSNPAGEGESSAYEPIHTVAMDGDTEEMKSLLTSDPSLCDRQDEFGMSPLHYAADRGNADIVRILLEHGADHDLKDSEGLTAFQLAEPLENHEVLDLLRPRAS